MQLQGNSNKVFAALLVLVFAALGILTWNRTYAATSIFVDGSVSQSGNGTVESPYKTITQAVNAAGQCDNIIVKPGEYRESVTVPASASGRAASGQDIGCKTTIRAESSWKSGSATKINANYQYRYGFNLSQATNIRVEGFEIYGQAPTAGQNNDSAGIWVGASGHEVIGNNIHSVGGCVTVANDKGQNAIFLDGDNSLIDGNYIHDIGRSTAAGCVAGDQAHDHGIYVNGSGNGQTGNQISNNLLYNNRKGWAVQIYPGTVDNLKLVHNTFAENASGNGSKLGNNIITGYGTTISNSTISNNIFYNSNGGSFKTIEMGNSLTVISSELNNNVTSGSAMSDNATNLAKFSIPTSNRTGVTPTFVDAGAQNYNLAQNDSFAKDLGVATNPTASIAEDYNGEQRSAPFDIGAFEFVEAAPTCSTKQGDVNNDNLVDIYDLSIMLSNYGKNVTGCVDLDGDGTINIYDLSTLLTRYGS